MCFCFKQKTAYDMRISDWSSDVCSSDLLRTAQSCIQKSRIGFKPAFLELVSRDRHVVECGLVDEDNSMPPLRFQADHVIDKCTVVAIYEIIEGVKEGLGAVDIHAPTLPGR